jgi:hypothetical protein
MTPKKSSMPRVLRKKFVISFTIENLAPYIDFDTSNTINMFFEPVVAATYHGLTLGS